jgi:hypothetical protein
MPIREKLMGQLKERLRGCGREKIRKIACAFQAQGGDSRPAQGRPVATGFV